MDEQPNAGDKVDSTGNEGDGEPRLFKNLNGWIAGATGLVIALGGLLTAYRQFTDKPVDPAPQQQVMAGQAAAADPAPADEAAEQQLPQLYEGTLDGAKVRMEVDGELWVLTDKNGRYEYEEVASPDATRIRAYSKEYDSYLRWPIEGGMAEESKDKSSWDNYTELDPVS